jgi:nascent polypeptide-associated complex subunit alpha
MKISQKQLEHIMKQMGMQMETIKAEEVIIKTEEKDIIIKNPEVAKIKVMGKETFQISGDVKEIERIKEEDIDIVVDQTGIDRNEARRILNETGDIAEAIMRIKNEQRK